VRQHHLANLIVKSKNYYDSSANALDNPENLAYSRASDLITVETALDLDGSLGYPLMAEGSGGSGGRPGDGPGREMVRPG
jgi:hypothetical protein